MNKLFSVLNDFKVVSATLTLFEVTVDAAGVNRDNGVMYNTTQNNTEGNLIKPALRDFYAQYILENAEDDNIHGQFGIEETVSEGHGPVVVFEGQDPYPAATEPLQEGVTPVGNKLSYRKVIALLYQYGAYTPVTDLMGYYLGSKKAVQDTAELGAQAGRTIDEVNRECLNGGTSVLYAPIVDADGKETAVLDRSAITADAKFTIKEIFKAARFLKRNKAKPFGDSYVAIIHPDVEYDVMISKGFIAVTAYTEKGVERMFKGELGKIGNVRFVVSPQAKIFEGAGADGVDVYSTLVFGQKAYGTISMQGGNLEHIVQPVGSAGAADPLKQRGSRGWKVTHGVVRLCETNMVRIESAASPI